jgi:hypothetical protein
MDDKNFIFVFFDLRNTWFYWDFVVVNNYNTNIQARQELGNDRTSLRVGNK